MGIRQPRGEAVTQLGYSSTVDKGWELGRISYWHILSPGIGSPRDEPAGGRECPLGSAHPGKTGIRRNTRDQVLDPVQPPSLQNPSRGHLLDSNSIRSAGETSNVLMITALIITDPV